VLALALTASGLTVVAPFTANAASPYQDWPTYLHDAGRSATSAEAIITQANAPTLKKKWATLTGGGIVASPAVVNGVVYEGSWDGFEYALNYATGAVIWKTNLGLTNVPAGVCHPPTLGITSGAAVVNGVVYVGGNDNTGGTQSQWYALNATDGTVLWKVPTGDTSQVGAHYNWSSPLIVGNFGYIGIASNCDNPLIQGQLLKVDLTTHQIVNTVNFVPNGQVGGGIWTSPTYDAATNTVYVSTGTLNQYSQTLSQAIVAIDAGSLAVRDHWQMPFAAAVLDSDFGTTPTLTVDKQGHQLLSVANKNGVLYTLTRCPAGPTCNTLSAGPVWQRTLAIGGDCPVCGDGTISSGAFVANTTVIGPNGPVTGPILFYATGNASINGTGYRGALYAIDPGTGTVLWTNPNNQPVFGSIAYANGVLLYAQGPTFEAVNAANGQSLYDYTFNAPVYGAVAVSRGQAYVGVTDGNMYAFGLPGATTAPPPDPNCPTGYTCQDIHNPGVAGSETNNADGSMTVTAAGTAIHGTGDQFRFIWRPSAVISTAVPGAGNIASGDGQVLVDLTQQSTQNVTPQAGIMFRQSADPQSPFYAVLEYPNNNPEKQPLPVIRVWYRTQFGANAIQANKYYPTTYPQYMLIQRQGDVFTASVSTDGVNYVAMAGSTATVVMPASLMEGIAVDSGAAANTGTATFAHLATGSNTITPALPAMADPCPAGGTPAAWQCQDVGNPAPVGDQTLNAGQFTVYGSGTGIQKYSDAFHFVAQSITGDGTITAQLTSFANNAVAATQAGLVMRQSVDPAAAYYGILLKPTGGATVQWRVNQGLPTRQTITLPGTTPPAYIGLSRFTDTSVNPNVTYYSAQTSVDGSNWNPVPGSTVAINMGGGKNGPTLFGMAATSNVIRATVAVTFQNVTLTTASTRPPGVCLAGWTCQDVGSGQAVGWQSTTNDTGPWTVSGSGGDIWDVYDQFRFISQPLAGDGTVSARVVSATANAAGPFQKSGVMIRAGSDPQAPYFGVFVTPANGVAIQYRTAQAGTTQQVLTPGTPPVYIMASRFTQNGVAYYSAYTSTDGTNFTWVPGSTVALTLPGTLLAGMAVDSANPGSLATTVFDNVAILPSAPAPPGICPANWTCTDIGAPLPAGQQFLNAGTWTFQSGGGDIWGAADSFHLAWQPLPGDGTASVRVAQIAGAAGAWAKEGVMVRASTDPGSPYYGVFATPSNGVAVQWRATQGGATSQIDVSGAAPVYVRITRWTDTSINNGPTYYAAYTSTDGISWTLVLGSTLPLNMPGTLLAGMATDSHNQGSAANVTMDSWALGNAVAWRGLDINGAAPGAQTEGPTTLNVTAGGTDIWGTADQFRYVMASQTLPGDGAASVHIASISNGAATWAKEGVMLRQTTSPGSPYYGVFATPGHGIVVQWRATQGAATNQVGVAGTAPVYLRAARWTDTSVVNGLTYMAAYTSPDGVTWTLIPGSAMPLNLPGTLIAGIATDSYDAAHTVAVGLDSWSLANTVTWHGLDINGAAPAGSQIESPTTMTVSGGGGDIWGTSDQFRYVIYSQTLAGDGTAGAHVTSQTNSDPWAKAGVMLRATTDPSSPYYGIFLTPGNGIVVQWRDAQGNATAQVGTAGSGSVYLNITRTGTTFSAAISTDGVTYTPIAGSSVNLPNLSGALLSGLSLVSHNQGILGTATFDTVNVP
jgi:outer membrane protein assembly factor BamB